MRPEPSARLLRRLDWTLLRPLANRLGGNQKSIQRGAGIELTEVREYQPGDDVRHIDWNITARTDRPHVRESFADRAIDVWLLADCSASIDWGTARRAKRDQAVDLAAMAGALLTGQGNRIGVIGFADRIVTVVPPGAGRPHLMRVVDTLERAPAQLARTATDLTGALDYANRFVRRRSMLILVSDFLTPDGWEVPLRRLAQRHEVVAVRVADPREHELPDVGLLTLEDPETGRQLFVDSGDRGVRERFRTAALAERERVIGLIRASRADVLEITTDADVLPALVRFLQTRRATRGARRG
jgi:uncharacterized protein (DUF58 family)